MLISYTNIYTNFRIICVTNLLMYENKEITSSGKCKQSIVGQPTEGRIIKFICLGAGCIYRNGKALVGCIKLYDVGHKY